MSFEAMAWAVKQKTANAGQKLVLLLLANHANGHTGQCNPSHKLLASECCMAVSTLKIHLDVLEYIGLLTVEHRSQDGVSLPNQYWLNIGVGQNPAEGGSESGRGVGQNPATNLEVKPINKPSIDSDLFEQFWKFYPRKTNKGFARKVFSKLKVDQELLNKMLKALAVQVPQWKDPQYIPHPSTWLNGERWLDEPQFKTIYSNHGEI